MRTPISKEEGGSSGSKTGSRPNGQKVAEIARTRESVTAIPLVIIESPFGRRVDGSPCTAKELAANLEYARLCLADCVRRGEAGFGSHLLYPQCLDDATPEERKFGMEAGFAWGRYADRICVYIDHGTTPGMQQGINYYKALQIPIEYRKLSP